jgi:hypothetical protein
MLLNPKLRYTVTAPKIFSSEILELSEVHNIRHAHLVTSMKLVACENETALVKWTLYPGKTLNLNAVFSVFLAVIVFS